MSTGLTNRGQCAIDVQVDLLPWVEMPCPYMLLESRGGRRICKVEDYFAWINGSRRRQWADLQYR